MSSGRTPDVSADMKERLVVDEQMSTDDEAEDSLDDEDSSVEEDDALLTASIGLPVASLPTGLCYDERMRYHSEVSATTGENVHPEDPRRIYYIFKELKEAGLVADGDDKSNVVVQQPLLRIDAREATEAECCLIHTQAHYDFVKSTASLSDEELIDLSEDIAMDSIYFNSLSYFSSKLSAGGAIETCRAVVNRTVKNAIAVIRPPGHHAEVQSTMGFWNGCQKAFYDDPNILYISLHLHMDGRFYPSGPEGGMDRVGIGPGVGKNVNIPWPNKGMGDADYMYAFQHVVMPIANEFDPDLVIVASGFDAAAGDELGGCFVTPPCYAHMTHMLMSLANGKIAVCLEGGYNFRAISKSALAVTRTLMGEPPDRLEATQATLSAVETVEKVRQIQSRYWQSIYPKGRWPANQLYQAHKMTNLPILRDTISPSFKDQVLATRDYDTKANLLIIFHDPPEVTVPPGRLSTLVSPSNAQYHDMVPDYIRQAISLDFGVIDVNIPVRITTQVPPSNEIHAVPYASADVGIGRKQGVELANYLWVNYIEALVDRSAKTFLMGCGNAFHAVAGLISESETIYDSLEGVVGFIATSPVRPVSSPSNPWVSSWYRDNSRIYVSKAHSVWQKSGNLSRKYGSVVRSEGGTVVSLMQAEADDCWEWIKDKVEARDESSGGEMEVEDGEQSQRR
ncbi:hypothetical protein DV735_g1335, partial [Chaetothyriales sp. CBS 134920]